MRLSFCSLLLDGYSLQLGVAQVVVLEEQLSHSGDVHCVEHLAPSGGDTWFCARCSGGIFRTSHLVAFLGGEDETLADSRRAATTTEVNVQSTWRKISTKE